MKGQLNIWSLLIGLLIFGLVAPVVYNIFNNVVGGLSDVVSQVIVYASIPIMFFLIVFVILFFRGGGDNESDY